MIEAGGPVWPHCYLCAGAVEVTRRRMGRVDLNVAALLVISGSFYDLLTRTVPPNHLCYVGMTEGELDTRIAALNRQDRTGKIRQLGGLMDLFIGLFREAGTWSAAEIAGWHKRAGLEPRKPQRMWLGPDLALQVGQKPSE